MNVNYTGQLSTIEESCPLSRTDVNYLGQLSIIRDSCLLYRTGQLSNIQDSSQLSRTAVNYPGQLVTIKDSCQLSLTAHHPPDSSLCYSICPSWGLVLEVPGHRTQASCYHGPWGSLCPVSSSLSSVFCVLFTDICVPFTGLFTLLQMCTWDTYYRC